MERDKRLKKYKSLAALIKMFRPDIKTPFRDIVAELFQADENRMEKQALRMKRGVRQSVDIQRILDFPK